jgi:anthranilate phosphoribosyltransferase
LSLPGVIKRKNGQGRALPLQFMTSGSSNAFLARFMRDENLSRAEASQLLDWLLDGATDAQIAATLIALKRKGETVQELAGLAEGMRARATRINTHHQNFIDTAGTGSSSAKTFNVSTVAAFVIAAAGLPVAKHGNRAASSKCGSADVLSALGVNVSADRAVSESCLNQIGICFMFAPLYHSTTARVAAIRRELGVHTSFNLLGPLTNPAGAPRQIIGVWSRELLEPMAQTLALLGTERAWVVHGADGLDEITLSGRTFVAEARNGAVRTFTVTPEEFDVPRSELTALRCDDAVESASIIKSVLTGERRDAARDLVILNAAAALTVGGMTDDLREGARLASQSIDSGAAMAKLDELVRATNSPQAS